MYKKGMSNLMWNLILMIILVVFTVGVLTFALGFTKGAAKEEDYQVKRIVAAINEAEPGVEILLDVTDATKIGFKNGKGQNNMFSFDNVDNLVIVSLRNGRATGFSYFNDVDIVDWEVRLLSGGDVNILYFRVVEVQKNV